MQATNTQAMNVNKTPAVIEAYKAAFLKAYPQKNISVYGAGKGRGFWVEIDGDRGDRSLTTDEMKEATAMLNA